jgi:hypothetical protein
MDIDGQKGPNKWNRTDGMGLAKQHGRMFGGHEMDNNGCRMKADEHHTKPDKHRMEINKCQMDGDECQTDVDYDR